MAAAKTYTSKIYTDHHKELKLSLLKKAKDETLVDDILQDSFLKLYLNINDGKLIDNPQAWLYRVSHNLLMDHYRKGKKQDFLRLDVSHEEGDKQHGPEDCLLGIIASLPFKYKKAVYLTDVKGVPQIESAKTLKISLSTFKSHVQRGRKLVSQGYVDYCDYTIDERGLLKGESKDWRECKLCSAS